MMIDNIEELKEKIGVEYYKCGSTNLANYLIDNNHAPIKTEISKRNNKILFVFILTDSLSLLLKNWTNKVNLREEYNEKRK